MTTHLPQDVADQLRERSTLDQRLVHQDHLAALEARRNRRTFFYFAVCFGIGIVVGKFL